MSSQTWRRLFEQTTASVQVSPKTGILGTTGKVYLIRTPIQLTVDGVQGRHPSPQSSVTTILPDLFVPAMRTAMRLLLSCFAMLLTLSFVVGCSSTQCCQYDEPAWQNHDHQGCGCHKSSWPKLSLKKKCKHKQDNCPLCAAPKGHSCAGCGAPMSYGAPANCSCGGGAPTSCGCGSPSFSGYMPSNCGSCSAPQMSSCGCGSPMPASCSACGGAPYVSPQSGPLYEGEVIPGQNPMLNTAPTPAPPAEDRKTEPAPLAPMGSTLIPILPPSSGPRQVNWVPTPVK